jgi:hypothetical protein
LSTDGDVSKTLHSLFGGGGAKLSTGRFSPVAIAVEGRLLPPKENAWDPASLPKSPRPGDPLPDPFAAPFDAQAFMKKIKGIIANVQGELDVERIHFTLDFRQWQDYRQKTLRPLAIRGAKALTEGNFEQGRAAIEALLAALDAKFGRFAPRIVTYDELVALRDILRVETSNKKDSGTDQVGVVCDRARYEYRMEYGGPFWSTDEGTERREVGGLLAGLYECATRHYEKAAREKPESPEARLNAARLVMLLVDPGWDEFDAKKRAVLERRAKIIAEKWSVEGRDEPL